MIPKRYTDADLAALDWLDFIHKPTPVQLAEVTESGEVPLPGDQPNLHPVRGEYLARSGTKIWKLTREEVAALYEPV